MSLVRNPVVDRRLESHQENLAPLDVSYTHYCYERVNAHSGNPQQLSGGQNLVFQFPEYSDSVYDLNESYIEMRIQPVVTFTLTGVPGTFTSPLSAYSTAAVEKFFLSGLWEDIDVHYGGVPLQDLDATNQLFPLLHSVYTMVSSETAERYGAALNRTSIKADPTNGVIVGVRNQLPTAANPRPPRRFDIVNDCEYPYNQCLGASRDNAEIENNNVGIAIQSDQVADGYQVYEPNVFTANYKYRAALIVPQENNQVASAAVGPSGNFSNNGEITFTMKLCTPFSDRHYKTPANIPLKYTFRRSRNVRYSVAGDPKSDAYLASGTGVVLPDDVATASYDIQIREMVIYAKRLTLSENQRMVLYESPSLVYDLPNWSAQQFDLTGQAFNRNVTFSTLPELVLIALVKKANIAVGNSTLETPSVYDTAPRDLISFNQLQINTSLGRIPEDPYKSTISSKSLGTAQEMRAYKEFVKALASDRKAPISFKTWLNCHCWYAFILNPSGSNPNYVAARRESSSINIQATTEIDAGVDRNDFTLVVVSMERSELVINGLRQVIKAV